MYDPAALTVPAGREGEHDRNPPHFRLTQQPQPDFSAWREPGGHAMHGCHSHLHDRAALAKDIAVYYGMISMMDHRIGLILDKLDELGLAEETVVVFTSDHGHFYGHHGLTAKGPFLYEDMIRVPFIVSRPGHFRQGTTSPALQSLVDLAPTFLTLAGADVPRTMTGADQATVWRGDASHARDHVIVENRHQPTTIHQRTYVDRRHKITAYYNRACGELFDLEEDPGEFRNLWDDPAARELKGDLLLKLIHAELGKEPIWMPRVCGA
jgi:uncharacterized sulfatase